MVKTLLIEVGKVTKMVGQKNFLVNTTIGNMCPHNI